MPRACVHPSFGECACECAKSYPNHATRLREHIREPNALNGPTSRHTLVALARGERSCWHAPFSRVCTVYAKSPTHDSMDAAAVARSVALSKTTASASQARRAHGIRLRDQIRDRLTLLRGPVYPTLYSRKERTLLVTGTHPHGFLPLRASRAHFRRAWTPRHLLLLFSAGRGGTCRSHGKVWCTFRSEQQSRNLSLGFAA